MEYGMVRVEYGVVRVEYEKNQTRRHPRDKTHPRVDEFCRVDGVEFDFVHISCVELSLPSGISELYHDA